MSFEPTPEDERKLHNEITEIGRQRFVLTTLAVTLFGVLTAWMVPKDFPKENTDIGPFPFAISMIISTLLFSIYFWHHMLGTHQQICANYLIVADKSNWEVQLRNFRKKRYHEKPNSLMFLVLTALGTVFPFALSKVLSLTTPSGIVPAISAALGIGVALLIYLMAFQKTFDKEERISDEWKALRKEAEAGSS